MCWLWKTSLGLTWNEYSIWEDNISYLGLLSELVSFYAVTHMKWCIFPSRLFPKWRLAIQWFNKLIYWHRWRSCLQRKLLLSIGRHLFGPINVRKQWIHLNCAKLLLFRCKMLVSNWLLTINRTKIMYI